VAYPTILKRGQGGERQFISSVLINHKCAQQNICILYEKAAFWKKWANGGGAAAPHWIRHCILYLYGFCSYLGQSCVTAEGWTGVSDHIYSNRGNGEDAYLILNVDVDGFVGKVEFVDGKPLPVGTVSFLFETFCTEQCTFMFMQVSYYSFFWY